MGQEQNESEKKLRNSEALYKDIVELGNIGIAVDDIDGKLIYFNKQFADIFGYSEDEIKKQSHKNLVHPDDFQKVSEIHRKRMQGENAPLNYEFKALKKDESIVYIYISASCVIKKNGQIIGSRSYLHDITKRKQAEELLRESEKKYITFIDSSPDLIYLKDENLKHIVANKSLCEFYNKSLNEIIWKTDFDIMDKISAANCRLSDNKTLKINKINTTIEKLDKITFETIKFPVEYKKGKIGVGGFIRNITEQSKAEEDLKNKIKELNEFNSLMINREIRMIELKKEVNELLVKSGKEEKYEI